MTTAAPRPSQRALVAASLGLIADPPSAAVITTTGKQKP
jgi:hypothetical protein